MFGNLEVFRMSHAMAVHAGYKQAITAQNVANSDTPEYKARDVIAFASTYQDDATDAGSLSQKATRASHFHGNASGELPDPIIDDRALAIYKSSMTILRTALSRT